MLLRVRTRAFVPIVARYENLTLFAKNADFTKALRYWMLRLPKAGKIHSLSNKSQHFRIILQNAGIRLLKHLPSVSELSARDS